MGICVVGGISIFYLPTDLADELRKSKFLIVQKDFVTLLMSYGESYAV
jgi:hypothetical protein